MREWPFALAWIELQIKEGIAFTSALNGSGYNALKKYFMPFTKVWLHLVWSTRNKAPVLTDGIRQKIFAYIKEKALSKGVHADTVNGHVDHVHALVLLGTEQTISKIVQLLKGESSLWANQHGLLKTKLWWQDDYFAVSVSESVVDKVRDYIKNQEAHHLKKTFQQEYDEFMAKYGFATTHG